MSAERSLIAERGILVEPEITETEDGQLAEGQILREIRPPFYQEDESEVGETEEQILVATGQEPRFEFDESDEILPTEDGEIEIEEEDLLGLEEVYCDDPAKEYLQEIGKIPLLTPEEEIVLTRRLKLVSVFLSQVRDLKLVPDEERRILIEKYGIEEKKLSDEFCNANLRLVASIAKKYLGRGLAILDLIQEGNIGLIRAARKFNPYKLKEDGNPHKFSTYATWWIRQAITRAIADTSRVIRLPVHMHEKVKDCQVKWGIFLKREGREPTVEELAEELGEKNVERVKEMIRIIRNFSKLISLNSPVGEEGEGEMGDFVADESLCIEDQGVRAAEKEAVTEVLGTLAPRERKIIELRFGIEDGRSRTLEEVGREFNVTRERIRQIEAKVLRKLRRRGNLKRLVRA